MILTFQINTISLQFTYKLPKLSVL